MGTNISNGDTIIHDKYIIISLSLDIMFVKIVESVIKLSINIKFITYKFILNRRQEGILATTKKIKSIY